MAYRGEGRGEQGPGNQWIGHSGVNIQNAIRAAVHTSGLSPQAFVIDRIEVTSKGDPDVGAYKVIITPI